MADAVNTHHDAPLQFGVAFQKALRVIGQCADHRDRQKHIHRNKHGHQVKVAVDDQRELNWQNAKKSQHQAAVIALARR